ncbi:MAG: hypothetical protein Ct9H90mP23_1370 [Methanobacteriota archaeon]|nr:MAG: hypothetical protein Ct9H90mP23_1370 [Euryarchaeota archaeon]
MEVNLEVKDSALLGKKGVVACATSMSRAIDLSEDSIAYADVVAPMIRDVGLALSMGSDASRNFQRSNG